MSPRAITHTHITILSILAGCEECNYPKFRTTHNPWRTSAYFDGQMKWLARQGFLIFTGSRTIQITTAGKEIIQTSTAGVLL